MLAGTVAAVALAAAPALATEGPLAPPRGPQLPSTLRPVTPWLPGWAGARVPTRSRPVIQRARFVHRRVRRGRRAVLRLLLSRPASLRIVIRRRTHGHRVRVAVLNRLAPKRRRTVRLPARRHGHALFPDRYRVSVVAIDAFGARSAPVRRTLIVRHRARS